MEHPLASFGRFAPPAQRILAALQRGPAIPAVLREDVRRRCGDDIGPGTLFGAISRLERRGLVEVIPSPAAPRAYRLTGLGAETLEALLAAPELRRPAPQPSIRSAAA